MRSWPKYRSSPIFSYLLCFIAVLLTVSAQVIHRVADNAVCYIDNGLKLHAFDRLGKLLGVKVKSVDSIGEVKSLEIILRVERCAKIGCNAFLGSKQLIVRDLARAL